MTLRIHAPTFRVGETRDVVVTSDNPGIVSLTYGAGLTGPATCEITGTRVWRNGLKHGQYLARANCLQARVNCAWFIELPSAEFTNSIQSFTYLLNHVIGSFRHDAADRVNWIIGYLIGKNAASTHYLAWYVVQSANASSNCAFYTMTGKQITGADLPLRLVLTHDGTNLQFYHTTGTSADSTVSAPASGTMGGSEVLTTQAICKWSKMEGSLPSRAQREAFIASGTLPSGLAASYQGGHEIVESAPVFWDTSGNNLDLSDVDVTYWPEAAASGDYTDTVPVVPYAIVPVTVIATTGTTIDATRPRQGVPARASYSERTEVADQCIVTVNNPTGAVGPEINARIKIT